MDGQHRGLVAGPEIHLGRGPSGHGGTGSNHSLEEGELLGGALVEHIGGYGLGWREALDPLQVDHIVDLAREDEAIGRSQGLRRRYRGDRPLRADHLDQEHAGQVAEAGLGHRQPIDGACGVDGHRDDEVPAGRRLTRSAAVGQ